MVDPYYDEDHPVIAELTKRVKELEAEKSRLNNEYIGAGIEHVEVMRERDKLIKENAKLKAMVDELLETIDKILDSIGCKP